MTKRNLFILLVVAGVLSLFFFVSESTETMNSPGQPVRLLGSVNADSVRKIKLEKDKQSLELELHDGLWAIPSRNYYPAKASKVRALLLKLFDLSSNQKVPNSEE